MPDRETGRRPWHVWAVGVFFLLLTTAGAYDQIMILTQNTDYFRSEDYGPVQRDYFSNYPLVPAVFWTIGVWSTLAAAVFLLLQRRWAAGTALFGLVGQVGLAAITFAAMDRWSVFGAARSFFDIAILLLTAGFAAYCWSMSARGLLR